MVDSVVRNLLDQFNSTLAARADGDDVRKVANLIRDNLDRVASSAAASGQRRMLVTEVLRAGFDEASPIIHEAQTASTSDPIRWTRIHDLIVGPFRGFRWQVTVPLDKRFVLFYGPNGSGKSSLCEALEYALLGSCLEAEERRLREGYFLNVHAQSFDRPRARYLDRGVPVDIQPDHEKYRFCFIEKNRIESFARISANPSAKAAASIASLFGIEPFNRFVRDFSDDLRCPRLEDAARELNSKRAEVDRAKETIGSSETQYQEIAVEERALCERVAPGRRFDEVRRIIEEQIASIGTEEEGSPSRKLTGAEKGRLRTLWRHWADAARESVQIESALVADASKLAFAELYEAILKIRTIDTSRCPACETPIGHTETDPFVNAERHLTRLQEVSRLQLRLREVRAKEEVARSSLVETAFSYVRDTEGEAKSLQIRQSLDELSPASYASRSLSSLWRYLAKAERLCVRRDFEIREASRNSAAVTRLIVRREALDDAVVKARGTVASFEAENAALLERVRQEEYANARIERICTAYAVYVRLLKDFLAGLPSRLVANLNSEVMELYNAFNEGGRPEDDLIELRLPTAPDGAIMIRTQGAPDELFDALHILSEGHLRCLGLAILLAKNLQLQLPLIVFDDVVNAIDHDHRWAIRSTLFDGRFGGKQFIVTSHSNEFIKDLQNQATAKRSRLIVVKPHSGDFQPRLIDKDVSRHYVERARAYLDVLDHRSALAHARQALECQMARLWRELTRARLGQLTLNVPGLLVEPELRTITEALYGRWRELVNPEGALCEHAERLRAFSAAFESVARIQHDRLWVYLNKGTHERPDLDDFEAPVVRQVVDGLTAMEMALEGMNLKRLLRA